jgi:hypothetical protein
MELRKSANILKLRDSYELRNSETHWSAGIPWNCQAPKQSSSIQWISGHGALTVQLGQEWGNKSNRGRARLEGDGWGGDTCGHIATSHKTACMNLFSTYHDPSRQGGIPPSPHVGSRLAGNVKSSNPTNIQGMLSSSEYCRIEWKC